MNPDVRLYRARRLVVREMREVWERRNRLQKKQAAEAFMPPPLRRQLGDWLASDRMELARLRRIYHALRG